MERKPNMKVGLGALGPAARIREMKARLDALDESAHPAIPAHVQRIRDIHDSLSDKVNRGLSISNEEWLSLKEADDVWFRIMVLRDVIPKAVMGAKHSKTQSKRRADKPANDPDDTNRNARVRALHARLTKKGDRDATAQTAREFHLSPRQVSRIVAKPRTHPG